jgi:anthranilate phosphoribosyltransferase
MTNGVNRISLRISLTLETSTAAFKKVVEEEVRPCKSSSFSTANPEKKDTVHPAIVLLLHSGEEQHPVLPPTVVVLF